MSTLKIAAWILFAIVGIAVIVAFSAPNTDTVPVGTVIAWAGESDSVPADWMICDGRSLKKNKYAGLYAAIGQAWGGGGNRFNLPDLRGRFIRGVDGNAGRDPDADDRDAANQGGNTKGVGSVQNDSIQQHGHYQPPHSHRDRYSNHYLSGALGAGGTSFLWNATDYTTTDSVAPSILGVVKYKTKSDIKKGEETRPKNANVYFIIKVN